MITSTPDVRDLESEAEIAGFLRGERVVPRNPASFASTAVRHGVAPLAIHYGAARYLPATAAETLRAEARRQAAIAALRERELRRVLQALHADGLEVLLFKGVHLANTCYPESSLRPRDDTDMLVREEDRERAARTLARLGYLPQPVQTGHRVLGQTMFDRPGAVGATLDVHWRAVRQRRAAALFDFDDLMSRAAAVPRLGEHARGPGPADALALACVHLAAHHPEQDLLLWTYDVHLLLERLTPSEEDAFVRSAIDRGIAALAVAAIEPAASRFRNHVASRVADRLRLAARDEASASLLDPGSRIDDVRLDLRAVRGPAKLRLLAAHLFPPAAYMRATYAPASRAPLPWLYLKRVVRALARA